MRLMIALALVAAFTWVATAGDAPKPEMDKSKKTASEKKPEKKEAPKYKKAPAFKLKGTDGKDYTLEQFKGKIVVLEWTNYNCPWVIPHYEQGNMQRLQKKYTAKGKDVIWLSIQSTKTNHRQYQKPEQMLATAKKWKAVPTAQLMDPVGKVGTAYGARMTPHMYVINKKGEVVYTGAIDNYRETRNREDLKSNRNYVAEVLDALLAGKTPKVQSTDPYG